MHTPGVKTIDELAAFLKLPATATVKAIVVDGDEASGNKPVLLLLRGDHELNEVKAQKVAGIKNPLTFAAPADILIEARWIIPVEPSDTTLEHHAVAVLDGRIVDILPTADARQRYAAAETVSLTEHVLIPGLVNLHCHAAMTLMRGLADDLPLMR